MTERAANCIAQADILLVATGAGFSADSGLAVYQDLSKEPFFKEKNLSYSDVCSQQTLDENPNIFYKFFFDMINQYKETNPHKGYEILLQIKEKFFDGNNNFVDEFKKEMKSKLEGVISDEFKDDILNNIPGPFFCYTSNVDGHFRKVGFQEQEIEEMHGCIDFWQCANPENCKAPFSHGLWWWLPKNHRFLYEKEESDLFTLSNLPKMSGFHREEEEKITKQCFESAIYPKCIACGEKARPNIVLFNDNNFVDGLQTSHYLEWEEVVTEFVKKGKKVVILEFGCGMNVPSIRVHTEELLTLWDTATLVRVNPTEISYTFIEQCENNDKRFIPIQETAEKTLIEIMEYIK